LFKVTRSRNTARKKVFSRSLSEGSLLEADRKSANIENDFERKRPNHHEDGALAATQWKVMELKMDSSAGIAAGTEIRDCWIGSLDRIGQTHGSSPLIPLFRPEFACSYNRAALQVQHQFIATLRHVKSRASMRSSGS
jgi:hypothetical protein